MIVTGAILVDLTVVKEDHHRGRVAAALGNAPNGAMVELLVGALLVSGDALRVLRRYADERHLSIVVKGEARAVQSWVVAIRTGEVCGMLLL